MTLEKLSKQIFDECAKEGEPVTMAEAEEMAEMELGAKGQSREARALEPKEKTEKKPKTVKISDEKQEIFNLLWEGLSNFYENSEILINNSEIGVKLGEKSFSIKVIEHRNKK